MTAHELANSRLDSVRFRVGKSRVIWETIGFGKFGKIYASRIVETGGMPLVLGLRYKMRYCPYDLVVTLV